MIEEIRKDIQLIILQAYENFLEDNNCCFNSDEVEDYHGAEIAAIMKKIEEYNKQSINNTMMRHMNTVCPTASVLEPTESRAKRATNYPKGV